jgi:hypothetical protein
MRLIILDILRRWFGLYVLCAIGAGSILPLEGGFVSVAFLMVPFGWELGRGSVGVVMTLPVSRKRIILSYWYVAVLVPTILMAGIMSLDSLLFPSYAVSPVDGALTLFGSLLLAGSIFCLFTYTHLGIVAGILLTWVLCVFLGRIENRPILCVLALAGVALTVWGYARSMKLFNQCGEEQPSPTPHPSQAAKQSLVTMQKGGGFGPLFFVCARNSFVGGLIYIAALHFFNSRASEDPFLWSWLFAFCTLGSSRVLLGGPRFLRVLPLSTNQLAGNLMLFPVVSVLATIVAIVVLRWVYHGQLAGPFAPAFLIPIMGSICVVSSLHLPFSVNANKSLIVPFGMGASIAMLNMISDTHRATTFWWIVGLCLIAAAFFLNRHYLRSSLSYRRPVGDS